MKTLLLILVLFLPSIRSAEAGSPGGVNGATESTQILNNVLLADGYAQQVLQYQNQLLQYEIMLKNLAENPVGNISPQIGFLISNHARVMAGSKDIGSTMARVDQDFAGQFQSPIAASFADKFRGWTTHSNDGLKAMALNAGAQREGFQSDENALKALVEKNQRSEGNLGALKTLGEINAQQLQESMKLRDLISQQQVAQASYLASETAKSQAKEDEKSAVVKGFLDSLPPSSKTSKRTQPFHKWDMYKPEGDKK
jgi:P-type conjugative transfer protein TrbJ